MFSTGGNVGSVLLILLGLAVAFALLARRVHIAYPVVLVLGGLGLSLLPGTPRIQFDPNFIFTGSFPRCSMPRPGLRRGGISRITL